MAPNSLSDVAERFDALRAANPDLGFAVYAYEPRGVVTLEIHTPEVGAEPYTFKGATLADALAQAFPEAGAKTPEPEPSIFD